MYSFLMSNTLFIQYILCIIHEITRIVQYLGIEFCRPGVVILIFKCDTPL